jgi:SAM-dependent methyltransferase
MLGFQCNICGADCHFPLDHLGRETPSCASCNSSPRSRAIVDIIARKLIGQSLPLPQSPENCSVRGLGLTDSENYASRLAQKFDYHNTYLHQEPHMDITAELRSDQVDLYDFVISSEIFEHVLPPVARAFENVFRLLKPGGLFVLTVPYGIQVETSEHFPDLNDFSVAEVNGVHVLTNVTREGKVQKFDRLVFHGGPGTTLEMRVFAERDIIRYLTTAGFSSVEIHREALFQFGIWWPQPWSRPISARKPGAGH